MTIQAQAVFDEVLMWPPTERAGLIEALLASFDAASRKSVDAAWAREAESRIDAYETRQLHSMPLDEAVDRINAK
jgi:putative addiction module component (TIGR02574 family)